MTSHRLVFVTPLFSRGSYDNQPEIRPPSIRGQLHWWFRALGGSYADEKVIFGGVHGDPVASKIVVRVSNIVGESGEAPTLPHKSGNQASPKAAFLPGTKFDLHLVDRLGGLDERSAAAFRRTLEAWLLAGTLGLRATRAGGSFVWAPLSGEVVAMPTTVESYRDRLATIVADAPLRVVLLEEPFATPEAARRCVSDTLGGRDDPQGTGDLSRLRDPLGRVFGGRKTSPLRFRIVKLGGAFRIIATWDGREAVTGNQLGDLQGIAELLARRGKMIGELLVNAFA